MSCGPASSSCSSSSSPSFCSCCSCSPIPRPHPPSPKLLLWFHLLLNLNLNIFSPSTCPQNTHSCSRPTQVVYRYDCLALILEMPFKDNAEHPDPEVVFGPAACRRLPHAHPPAPPRVAPLNVSPRVPRPPLRSLLHPPAHRRTSPSLHFLRSAAHRKSQTFPHGAVRPAVTRRARAPVPGMVPGALD